MSSIPSNVHPNNVWMGSTRLYVSQPVSLWNGTNASDSAWPGWRRAGQGQTSPRGMSSSVSLEGQMGERPSMRTVHSAAMCTRREALSNLDCASRKSVYV